MSVSKSIAFLFPGQGSQFAGMGKDFHDCFPEARALYEQAEQVLGMDLRAVCFNGPQDKLKQTQFTQPAMFVHSYIVFSILAGRGIRPNAAAGHSLGELSALACSGACTYEAGLKLVQERARLMQEAAGKHPGTMAAVLGLPGEAVSAICEEAGQSGIVVAANYNSPEQTVISGSKEGVAKAIEYAKSRGAKRAIELAVSGAFHSPLMQEAEDQFRAVLDKTSFDKTRFSVYSNVTARPIGEPSEIPQRLAQQLTHSVRWAETIRNMIQNGVSSFIEVGPGKVLSGLVKRIEPAVEVRTCGMVDELNAIQS